MTEPPADERSAPRSDLRERFERLGSLGRGGMGSVTLAYDARLRARVALKSVGSVAGTNLLRFKREFRAVKGLAHPNLVSLGELFEQDGEWFFSMEYIDGSKFLDYVRPPGLGEGESATSVALEDPLPSIDTQDALVTDTGDPTHADTFASVDGVVDGPFQTGGNDGHRFDEGRLRHSLLQLVEATHVLHESQRIHRDLKPSNVLVTRGGRVVVLDFGLISETERGVARSSSIVGTPAYMAPEQVLGGDLTPAVDCYAIGVMLFEALCGRWPVVGSAPRLLRGKQVPIRHRPGELTDQELPEDLERLSMDLLALEPEDRPTTEEVFARLGVEIPRRSIAESSVRLRSREPCIGRELELERLAALFEDTRAKRPRQVLVIGESGIGKTTVIRESLARFSEKVAAKPWVLHARCHEHEQVRYKAFDELVDQLSGELPQRISHAELRTFLPADAWLLSRAFPVLQRVGAFADLGLGPASVGDRGQLQRRMVAAFREFFFRLAERSHMVLVIEDLQWADTASWALLEELAADARPPPLALVVSARTELAAAPPELAAPFLALPTLERISLGPLDRDCVARFAALHGREIEDPELARRLEVASGGHPLYLGVLLRSATLDLDGERPPSLSDCLVEQARALDPQARRLLEILAVSDRPMEPSALAGVASLAGEQVGVSLEALRSGSWVRSASGREAGRVGVFHSQVREAVLAWMDPEVLRETHVALAELLIGLVDTELGGAPIELERAVTHLLAGDARERAIGFAEDAAEAAMDAMAFERAAELYALALDRPPATETDARALRIARGHALAWSGRRVEAASVYLDAADGADRPLALRLRSKAAIHLLSAGEFGRGQPVFDAIMRELGVPLPRSSGVTMMAMIRDTVMLRITSRRVRIDADVELDLEHQLRLELCQAGHWVYSIFDLLLTGYYSTTYARLALRSRERSKVASGLSHVAAFLSYMGDHDKARAMLREVHELLEGVDAPLIRGTVAVHEAICEMDADYDCVDHAAKCQRALQLLREAGQAERGDDLGVVVRSSAAMLARMTLAQALERAGDLDGLEQLWRELTADARNLDSERSLQVWILVAAPFTAIHLARNRPATSLSAADRGLELLETDAFLVPHLVALISRMRTAIYQGDPTTAVAEFEAQRDALRRSFTVRAPDLRADVAAAEAGARLALRAQTGPDARSERELGKALRFLERFPGSFQRGRGQAARAVMLAQDGEREAAGRKLAQALETFEGCRARAYAAATKLLLPRLRDDENARALRSEGLKFFLVAAVHDPDRFALMLVPGL